MIYDSDIFVIALRLSGWNSTQSKHGISRMSRWDYMQTKGGEAKDDIMGLPPPINRGKYEHERIERNWNGVRNGNVKLQRYDPLPHPLSPIR